MHFLRNYKIFLYILLLLGLSPVYVNSQNNLVKCKLWTRIYSIVYIFILNASFGILTIISQYEVLLYNICNNTCRISMLIETSAIILIFTITGILIQWNGQRQANFLNRIQQIDHQISAKFNIQINNRKMFKPFYIELSTIFCIFLPLNYFTIYLYNLATTRRILLYYMLVGWLASKPVLFVQHIKLMVKVLTYRIRALINELIKATHFENKEIMDLVYFIIKLFEQKDDLQAFFGVQILVIQLLDFCLITICVYYLIYISVFNNVVNTGFIETIPIYLAIYVFPSLIKQGLMACVFSELSDQVFFYYYLLIHYVYKTKII